ncbi:MAG: hypothetical protein FWC22_00765 [Treponema sp.]|nr:hypothetical protein [Treponema sp.]
MKNVLISGLKKEFDKKLAEIFAREGYKVFALGEEQVDGVVLLPFDPKEAAGTLLKDGKHIDIYIDVSDERSESDDFDVRSGLNDLVIRELYEANVIRPMAMLEVFFPLLEAGESKRICYLTSGEASLNETCGTTGYGYKTAKAGLHNFLQITRNALSVKNYTIRVFDPLFGEFSASSVLTAELSAEAAFNYFIRGRGVERGDKLRDDENNLVFRDAYGRQHPW